MSRTGASEMGRRLDEAQQAGELLLCGANEPAMRSRLDRRVEKGELVRPVPSSYARAGYWNQLTPTDRHLHIVRALSRQHPDWVFCGVSAAVVLGYDPTWSLLGKVHIASERGSRRFPTHNVVHHEIRGIEVENCGGIPITVPGRTLFDCLRTVPFPDGLALADRATRMNGWRDDHVAGMVEDIAGGGRYHGAKRAREVASLVDGRAESGGESIARANMMRLGFAQPELQVKIANLFDPRHPYRVDFGWQVNGIGFVVGEFDGRSKYTDPNMAAGGNIEEALLRERQRESQLSAQGVRIARFNYRQARDTRLLAQILDGFGIPRGGVWDAWGPLRLGYRRVGNVEYSSHHGVEMLVRAYASNYK